MRITQPLLTWHKKHGRKNLPWQQSINPYKVWISEIMLQQTQVKTVIPYFTRFMLTFPTVHSLAESPIDNVLALWAGLGYYARARNLHRTAQIIVEQHNGIFPGDLETLCQLPGIGRSTAGAILSIAFKIPTPILDGNVKRVLTRVYGIEGFPGQPVIEKALWDLAEKNTSKRDPAIYTQAIMDLGATLCTRTQPDCTRCPLQKNCVARLTEKTHLLPTPKAKLSLPRKQSYLLIFQNAEKQLLLYKRPPIGLWGGLWSFPECELSEDLAEFCQKNYGFLIVKQCILPMIQHRFSHFIWDITPLLITIKSAKSTLRIAQPSTTQWFPVEQLFDLGVAAPIKKLLFCHFKRKELLNA